MQRAKMETFKEYKSEYIGSAFIPWKECTLASTRQTKTTPKVFCEKLYLQEGENIQWEDAGDLGSISGQVYYLNSKDGQCIVLQD